MFFARRNVLPVWKSSKIGKSRLSAIRSYAPRFPGVQFAGELRLHSPSPAPSGSGRITINGSSMRRTYTWTVRADPVPCHTSRLSAWRVDSHALFVHDVSITIERRSHRSETRCNASCRAEPSRAEKRIPRSTRMKANIMKERGRKLTAAEKRPMFLVGALTLLYPALTRELTQASDDGRWR